MNKKGSPSKSQESGEGPNRNTGHGPAPAQILTAILNNDPDRAHDLLQNMNLQQLDALIDAIDQLGNMADELALQKVEKGER